MYGFDRNQTKLFFTSCSVLWKNEPDIYKDVVKGLFKHSFLYLCFNVSPLKSCKKNQSSQSIY